MKLKSSLRKQQGVIIRLFDGFGKKDGMWVISSLVGVFNAFLCCFGSGFESNPDFVVSFHLAVFRFLTVVTMKNVERSNGKSGIAQKLVTK